MRIGIHTSIAGDIAGALEIARKLGCNALQIFSASPRMWPRVGSRIRRLTRRDSATSARELGLGPLVIHANYLINLASLRSGDAGAFDPGVSRRDGSRPWRWAPIFWWCIRVRCGAAQTPAQAIRDGGAGDCGRRRAACACAGTLTISATAACALLLENTAGMGSAIGSRFEELQAILDDAPELPLGVCLDTAHAFEAGYEIHTEAGLAADDRGSRSLPWDSRALPSLHVNDSKTPFGSRVDRHEHIGAGKIGLEAFRRILTHPGLSASAPVPAAGRDARFSWRRRSMRRATIAATCGALWELAGVAREAGAARGEWLQHAARGARGAARRSAQPANAATREPAKRAQASAERRSPRAGGSKG